MLVKRNDFEDKKRIPREPVQVISVKTINGSTNPCSKYKSRLSLIKPQSVWDLFALDSQHLSATTTGPGVNIPQMYSL